MFEMHRVFCATPWEMEAERRLFYDVIGRVNETAGMPKGVLFVAVSLVNIADKRPWQYTIDDNIRESRHYILVLSDEWGPRERNLRHDYELAMQCLADPGLPMRDVAVLFKKEPGALPPAEGLPEPRAAFYTPDEFKECLEGLLRGWMESLPA